jgi:hypothetical protein
MNHHLINYSLLESLQIKAKGDVYDHCALLFVSVIFEQQKFSDFTIEDAQETFVKELNFNLPISVVQLVLKRAQNNLEAFTRSDHKYFPDKEKITKISEPFTQEKEAQTKRNTRFLESFIEYVKSVFSRDITIKDAQEMLFAYLAKYQVEIIDYFNVGQEIEIKGKSINNNEFLFSSYLKHINENDQDNFKCFVSQVKGIFLKNYMMSTPLRDNQSNLNNVTFYLDTPLILGYFGFNGDNKQRVIEEMIQLCNALKAKLAIFECTRIELENILRAWANDLENKNTRNFRDSTFQLLKMKGWDHVYLENFISRYTRILSNANISISPNTKYQEQHQIDHDGLKAYLKERAHNEYLAVEHDIKVIEQIVQIREYKNKVTLKDKISIFITTSNFLVGGVNEFFKKDFAKDAAPVISNDIWVTNMCWMMNPKLFPDWPEHLIVSNYQAIIYDDDKFWVEFVKRFKTLRDTQKITVEDFDLVRRENFLKNSLKMLSVTNGMSFNDEHIFDLVEKTKKRMLNRKDDKINSQGNIISAYRGKLTSFCESVSKLICWVIKLAVVGGIWFISYLASKGTGYEPYSHLSIGIGILFTYFGFNVKDFGNNLEKIMSFWLYKNISKLIEQKK